MSTIPLVETDYTEVHCDQCGEKETVRCLHVGTEAIRPVDLPSEWFVFDKYPPGDDGLGFACSERCLRAYWEERDR